MKSYIFLLVIFCVTMSVLAEPYLLDLSGGTGGRSGQKVYTSSLATVTSSAPTYTNGSLYYMEYLFNHSYSGTYCYWLTSSSGNQTLTIALNQATYLDYVRVYATSYMSNPGSDRRSNYMFAVSNDGVTYTNITSTYVNTASDVIGVYHDHSVLQAAKYIRFTLTQEASWGVSLNEIELYSNTTVPEPHVLVLLGLASLMCIYKKK